MRVAPFAGRFPELIRLQTKPKGTEMSKIDDVRALFVPGEKVICVENTYAREKGRAEVVERKWTVDTVGKTVWAARGDGNWRGTFPTRVGDILHVDATSATWRIGRDDHTVTYVRDAA